MKKIQFALCALLSIFAASCALGGCNNSSNNGNSNSLVQSSTNGENGNEDSTPDDGGNSGNETPTPDDGGNSGNETPTPDDGGNGGNETPTPDDGGNGGNETPTPDDGGNDNEETPEQSVVLATFNLGSNGAASHNDGTESSSQSFTANGYTLNISATNAYFNARDAKGNSCIKLGSSKKIGSLQFTVPTNVNSVELHIAKYKDKDSAVKINGTQYSITKNSNNGQYDVITVDTSSSKSVSLTTVTNLYRVMINTIVFHSGAGGNSGNQGGSGDSGNSGGNQGGSSNHTYTSFTSTEKNLFIQYFDEVIPFVANDDYIVEEYEYDDEYGINFYAYGVTEAEFLSYLDAFSAYESAGSEEDDYGDTWYFFDKDDYYVDVAYYEYDGAYIVDVYAYFLDSSGSGDSGNSGGSQGGSGGSGGSDSVTVLSNDGKGLPSGSGDVHTVDFKKATYVKTVADQGYYLDGCPTTGNVKVLVIPVQFSDVTASSKGYTVSKIDAAFNGDTGSAYPSVSSYYKTSSYGQLNLTFDVMDEWFTPKNKSSYYLNATMDYSGSQVECGDQIIIDEFLQAKNATIDFSQYDSDNNGFIDAVVLINTLDIDADVTMKWAYRYWNLYTDSQDYYYEYDGVSANDYLWASYAFMFENESGSFTDKSACNTYTFIHEFGHVLGSDDYYDTAYVGSPMGGNDIMDSDFGDHSAFTKFNYGWVTSSRLVTTSTSVTLSLEAFSKAGDTIILANNWSDELGAYQEYFLLMYYTKDGLNGGSFGYFDEAGIVVYHINATLYKEIYEDETYYDLYYNNTDASDRDYGTEHNLIELVKNGSDYVFGAGDKLSTVYTDSGNALQYTFTVNSLANGTASITVTKK